MLSSWMILFVIGPHAQTHIRVRQLRRFVCRLSSRGTDADSIDGRAHAGFSRRKTITGECTHAAWQRDTRSSDGVRPKRGLSHDCVQIPTR